jgi:hypothetical protein
MQCVPVGCWHAIHVVENLTITGANHAHPKPVCQCSNFGVDFEKAFDVVARDELLARCKRLGVHGAFLAAL